MDNNQNQQTPPGCIVAFIVFFLIASIVNITHDSIMLAIIIGAAVVCVGTALILGLKAFWDKADKKKLKKWSIIIGSSVLGIILVLAIANACTPSLTQDEVENLVIAEMEPQLDKVKSELGISNLTLELDVYDYEYKKPKIFSKGYIRFEVDDYYVSTEFTDLDNGIYTAETCNKYRKVPSLEYDDVKIPRYIVYISRRSSYSDTEFKDSSGDIYSFDAGQIFKNGSNPYNYYTSGTSKYSSSSGSSSKKKSKCSYCNGTGKCVVKWYSEGDWGETSYSSYTCTYCNGTGKR